MHELAGWILRGGMIWKLGVVLLPPKSRHLEPFKTFVDALVTVGRELPLGDIAMLPAAEAAAG